MAECLLSEAQRELLRSISRGLEAGVVKRVLRIQVDGAERVTSIVGISDGENVNEVRSFWRANLQLDDLYAFAECELVKIDQVQYQYNVTLYANEIRDLVKREFSSQQPITNTPDDPRIVFVVHGRNIQAKGEMFTFLYSLGLKPLDWSEAVAKTGKGSPYVGEVLDAAFNTAQAVIVLMTPDDEARLRRPFHSDDDEGHEIRLTPQARLNVIFEAGMAMGRFSDRTILVELGNMRPFSDIGGRHRIKLNNTVERRHDLVKRLEKAACPVDLSNTHWHKAGDFEGAIAKIAIGASVVDSVDWSKTGNLWWLCNDTLEVLGAVLSGSGRERIVDRLRRSHHHASQLHLDSEIINDLREMKEEAIRSQDNDWTPQKREDVADRVRRVFNLIAQLAQEYQVKNHPDGFKADPD